MAVLKNLAATGAGAVGVDDRAIAKGVRDREAAAHAVAAMTRPYSAGVGAK